MSVVFDCDRYKRYDSSMPLVKQVERLRLEKDRCFFKPLETLNGEFQLMVETKLCHKILDDHSERSYKYSFRIITLRIKPGSVINHNDFEEYTYDKIDDVFRTICDTRI